MSDFHPILPEDRIIHPEHYQIGIPVAAKRQRQKAAAPNGEFTSIRGLKAFLKKHPTHGVKITKIQQNIMTIIEDPEDKRGNMFEIRRSSVFLAPK